MTELEQIPVTALLPQQPPFIMIDALTDFSEKETATRLTVRKDNIFVERGRLTAYGVLENMAQTCAARLGYANYVLHKAVGRGGAGNGTDENRFERGLTTEYPLYNKYGEEQYDTADAQRDKDAHHPLQ